jgi:hypothetical protein
MWIDLSGAPMMTRMNTLSRRHFLRSAVGGSLLLPGILHQLLAADASPADPLAPKPTHFPAKAKRVIFLFMTGGVSHIDTFDPKPNGKGRDGTGKDRLMGCVFPYRADYTTGIEVADIFSQVRSRMRDICLLRSMKSAHFDHSEATLGMHTCSATFARPCLGSWLSYGLGTLNHNLPSFLVIAPKLPYGGTQIYANDFLPAIHQGTRLTPGQAPIPNLSPRTRTSGLQELELAMANQLDRRHLADRSADSALAARIHSFETAYRMQTAAPEAFDITGETDSTLRLYGLARGQTTGFGWQCLVARRLAERGVRFIELIHQGSDSAENWDAHSDIPRYASLAPEVDQPIAALLADLGARGMLDETLVVWATEFGRTPRRDGKMGRQHHGDAFSVWLAGGGVKGGTVHGKTDDRGYASVEGEVEVFDLHATILHQMGLDHKRLTYRHAGRDFRLTDVHGRVLDEILA